MKLKDLLFEVPVKELHADPEREIGEVFYDSRKVTPGSLFVAVSGFASDGNRFIPMALQKGAAVVVTARRPQEEIPYVLVESDRLALALISANFFGRPAERMRVIGVTGTNGKTSVTLLLKQVLEKCLGANTWAKRRFLPGRRSGRRHWPSSEKLILPVSCRMKALP